MIAHRKRCLLANGTEPKVQPKPVRATREGDRTLAEITQARFGACVGALRRNQEHDTVVTDQSRYGVGLLTRHTSASHLKLTTANHLVDRVAFVRSARHEANQRMLRNRGQEHLFSLRRRVPARPNQFRLRVRHLTRGLPHLVDRLNLGDPGQERVVFGADSLEIAFGRDQLCQHHDQALIGVETRGIEHPNAEPHRDVREKLRIAEVPLAARHLAPALVNFRAGGRRPQKRSGRENLSHLAEVHYGDEQIHEPVMLPDERTFAISGAIQAARVVASALVFDAVLPFEVAPLPRRVDGVPPACVHERRADADALEMIRHER